MSNAAKAKAKARVDSRVVEVQPIAGSRFSVDVFVFDPEAHEHYTRVVAVGLDQSVLWIAQDDAKTCIPLNNISKYVINEEKLR